MCFEPRIAMQKLSKVGKTFDKLPRLSKKSDLRNHQAIVQPRLYDSLMVTQITLKTEGPHEPAHGLGEWPRAMARRGRALAGP